MSAPLRVGIAGLGTVGAALARLLAANGEAIAVRAGRPVAVAAVSARDAARDRGVDLSAVPFFSDPVALARDGGVDVLVELIGGEEGPALCAVEAALGAGKPVVTANKALIARHGVRLARMAEEKGVMLALEAAVAGAIPAVRTVRDALAGDAVVRVEGILNGTCNYILTRMEAEGLDFATCLADAQRLGYAEADPTFDVDGHDTAHKLAILTSMAFGTEIAADEIHVEGIRAIEPADLKAAAELGFRIKLLGIAARAADGIDQRVHPTMVRRGTGLAETAGVLNAVSFTGEAAGEIVLSGAGAGGDATASAVLSDLVDVAAGIVRPPLGRPAAALSPFQRADIAGHVGAFYVRLAVEDRPGAFAAIAGAMGGEGISLESIVQRDPPVERGAGDPAPVQTVILVTYRATERAVARALAAIADAGVIASAPRVIRIDDA